MLKLTTVPPPPPPPEPTAVQVLAVGPQVLSNCAVRSQIIGSCVPVVAGLQLGSGCGDD